jgi:hypothetical protein
MTSNSTCRHLPKRSENTCPQKDCYKVHSSFIHYSPKLEKAQVFTPGAWVIFYPSIRIPLGNERKGTAATQPCGQLSKPQSRVKETRHQRAHSRTYEVNLQSAKTSQHLAQNKGMGSQPGIDEEGAQGRFWAGGNVLHIDEGLGNTDSPSNTLESYLCHCV